MPPGFGLLDTALVSIPVFLTLLGLIRGAPVELASCCGCLAGVVAAWTVSALPFVHGLGQPMGPLLALLAGMIVWRLARGVSKRLGFDTRWIDLGRIFDSFVGGAMGALRGVAFVSAACLSYAMIFVPFGLANPIHTVVYPVFLAVGSQVTSAVIERAEPFTTKLADAGPSQSLATVPLPFTLPQIGSQIGAQIDAPSAPPGQAPLHAQVSAPAPYAPLPPPPLPPPPFPSLAQAGPAQAGPAQAGPVPMPTNGPALAALLHVIAPSAAAAPTQPPMPVYHPDIPVRGIPVSLLETHHNILHPYGLSRRRPTH